MANIVKEEEIKQILNKLSIKSIEQLLQLDSIQVQKLSNRSRMHGELVQQCLQRLHKLILETQLTTRLDCDKDKQPLLSLSKIFPSIECNIERGQIVEILGRANSGKTFLLIQIVKLALSNNLKPIILCSGCHQKQYRQKLTDQQYMLFSFSNMCELSMLIHSIGNHIIQQSSQQFILLIDCLSQIDLADEIIEFDSSEKFRRLLTTFTNRTRMSIIYSYRINSSLFRTQYKKDQYRPKCKNSKQWDGWSSKSIFIDHIIRKKDLKVILRLNFPKSLNNTLYEIVL